MRPRQLPLLILPIVVLVALASCSKPNDPQARLKAAQAALDKGDTATAIRELEAVTGADPKQAEARVLLARAYEKAGRRDDAINQYQAAILLQSQDAQVGYHLGTLLVAAGKPADAAVPLALGVKLNTGMAISFTQEISAAVAAGLAAGGELVDKNPQQATQLLEAVTMLDARNARAHLLLGNAYINIGRTQEAIEQYKAILSLDPKNASAITNLGAAYYQMNRLDEATAQFQAALQLTPDDAETHYLLGAAYIQQNKVEDAKAEFQTALRLNSDLAAAYIGLGNVQLIQGDLDSAVSSLTKATQLAPNSPEAFYALGKALAQKGDPVGARQAFQRFLTLNPPPNLRAEVEELLKRLGP